MSQDFVNPFVNPYACPKCHDLRVMTRAVAARKDNLVPCDKCGLMPPEEYERFRRDEWAKHQPPIGISQMDLSNEELVVYNQMKTDHPHVAKTTILSWIEGRRYDPSKDPEFLATARQAFKEWRNR
jgi:hypothetical protein